jgi:hypothetical protein
MREIIISILIVACMWFSVVIPAIVFNSYVAVSIGAIVGYVCCLKIVFWSSKKGYI